MLFLNKPNVVSLLLHAGILAALSVIPIASMERFSSTGQRNVVAIELMIAGDVSPENQVTIVEPLPIQVTPPATSVDSPTDIRPKRSNDRRMPTTLSNAPMNTDDDSEPDPIARAISVKQSPKETRPIEIKPPTEIKRPRRLAAHKPPGLITPPTSVLAGLEESTKVSFVHNPPPDYPAEAVRLRLEGIVMLRITISESGKVQRVEIADSSGHGVLDRAAMQAVSKWHGEPATRWGHPVESVERLPIRFRL